jgi:hypothetical protein
MRNNNYIAVAVGIGIFGVFAIFIAWPTVTSNDPVTSSGPVTSSDPVTSNDPEVARDEGGAKLAAWKYTVYGPVRLPEAISRFEANGAKGLVTIRPVKEMGRLPVGQYHIRSWKTERKDDGGNTWVLAGQYFGQENTFEVNKSSEAKLDIGEPIVATVEARNVDSSYSFNQIIKGRHQESIKLTLKGSRPQPPKLHIKNKDGSYDRTFSFRYG